MENSEYTLISVSDWIRQQLAAVYPPHECQALSELLVEQLAGVSRTQRLLYPSQPISEATYHSLRQATLQLLQHQPVQHILGSTQFYGLTLEVNNNVLIPRPETEELVHWILSTHQPTAPLHILDIGTGSGCIAIALAYHLPQAQVQAWDVSEQALAVAQRNALHHHVGVHFAWQDILHSPQWSGQPLDIIVSNPPYVLQSEKADMQPNVLLHDPHLALFVPNEQPLLFYEAIAHFAWQHLRSGGWVYVEINQAFGPATLHMLEQYGFVHLQLQHDMHGRHRMARGQKP